MRFEQSPKILSPKKVTKETKNVPEKSLKKATGPDVEAQNRYIAEANSFESLTKAIKKVRFVRGFSGSLSYDSRVIIAAMDDIRMGRLDPSFITNQHGLRNKVIELINKENSK